MSGFDPETFDGGSEERTMMMRLFPEREIILRTETRVRYLKVRPWFQKTVVLFLIGLVSWAGFSSFQYYRHDRIVLAKEDEIARGNQAYRALLDEIANSQREIARISRELDQNDKRAQQQLASTRTQAEQLEKQNISLKEKLGSVKIELGRTERERSQVLNQREQLNSQLSALEQRLNGISNQKFSLEDNLNSVESELRRVTSERNVARLELDRMQGQVKNLQTRLGEIHTSQLAMMTEFSERSSEKIDKLENLLAMTGVNVESMISRTDVPLGQGGPLVEIDLEKADEKQVLQASVQAFEYQMNRWDALNVVLSQLPMALPVKNGRLSSTYGKRKDPVTGRWAMHGGIDYAAYFKTPIYSTAAGKVSYAGWKSSFGKVVEIDHGFGITTRYAHMHKPLVETGETVAFGQAIGQMGSTGRSTGTHLHYEVLLDGVPQDPMRFIEAGRYVFKEQ
ncbi:peptidoglycan DD-metalloendopeptidase family protein [Alphaproteobacteria bacterium HT1-32]|nr:peptidoglycan DD-metalloendopeptidase family protein [Alphaproteobacteria bacterium HT1-32]